MISETLRLRSVLARAVFRVLNSWIKDHQPEWCKARPQEDMSRADPQQASCKDLPAGRLVITNHLDSSLEDKVAFKLAPLCCKILNMRSLKIFSMLSLKILNSCKHRFLQVLNKSIFILQLIILHKLLVLHTCTCSSNNNINNNNNLCLVARTIVLEKQSLKRSMRHLWLWLIKSKLLSSSCMREEKNFTLRKVLSTSPTRQLPLLSKSIRMSSMSITRMC